MTIHIQKIGSVAHQAADLDNLARGIGRGNPIARRERRKLNASAVKEAIWADEQGVGTIAYNSGKGCLDVAAGAGVEDLNLQSEGTCSFRYTS